MLVASDQEQRCAIEDAKFSKRSVLLVIGQRGLPHLFEATFIPAVLFWVFLNVFGAGAAMITVLCWTFGNVLRRVLQGHRIPGVLLLATIGLIVRTVVALLSGSTFIYFMQPIATTVVLALVFLGSVLIGQPLVARLAADFCPIDADLHRRPGVMHLFSGLTILWAAVHLANAAATYGLLVTPADRDVRRAEDGRVPRDHLRRDPAHDLAGRSASPARENLVFAKVEHYRTVVSSRPHGWRSHDGSRC